MPAPPTAILWDMDGTLADSEPLHARALAATLADEGITPPVDLHAQVLGLGAQAIHALFQQRLGLRLGYAAWLARRWAFYLAHAPRLQARPGALQAFEAAAARAWPQAVVSNSNRAIIAANLAALGLAGRPALVVAAEDVRHPKPHPEPYLLARRRLGLPAGAVVIAVEDSAAGARAAVAAGCRTLYWPQQPTPAVPGAQLVKGDGPALWRAMARWAGCSSPAD